MGLAMDVTDDLDGLIINCIRTLSMDAVQKANSGHPGTAMALAPVAFKLWDKYLKHNPKNPDWPNRDRFVLSAGHASILLYSILHISGYEISLNDISRFRQLHSICAGHPEYGMVPGVETTSGPLGQGAANSVGMAIAEKWLAEYFNKPEFDIIDYDIFSITSDGDMMEGITSESASIAGHLKLGNLVWIYDNNHITIEGSTELSFSEDVAARFEAYNWYVQSVDDANDIDRIQIAISNSKKEKERPSLIIVDSHIAYGSPNKQDTPESHGAPLGEEEVKLTKSFYNWDPERSFYIPEAVRNYTKDVLKKGALSESDWTNMFSEYADKYPELAREFEIIQKNELPEGWDSEFPIFEADDKGVATRSANNKVLNAIGSKVSWLLGGAGDVGSSTKTYLKDTSSVSRDNFKGRNLHYGIREHAMAGITNGLSLSKLRPYASTYFVFLDYLKPSLRLSALMKLSVIYIFTHDSIGVGEDGPTHQPIEHLAALRAVPNIDVIRPADANEVSVLWRHIMNTEDRPTALILTRQNVPVINRNKYGSAEGALKGGYIIADSDEQPELIIISTGSEVDVCLKVYEELRKEDANVRVVSMPCWSIFDRQPEEYKESVLPTSVKKRLSVEAGSTFGWEKYVGINPSSKAFGIDRFGESAPCNDLMEEFGFSVGNLLSEARQLLSS